VRSGELIERELSAAPLRSESANFPHAAQAVCARRKTTHKKSGKQTPGTRHYLTSRSPAQAPPPQLAMLVRGHWAVENNIHWLRDAVWNEDACRTHDPNTACALALLRTALLAPLRRAGHHSPQQAIETFAHKPHLALHIILRQRLG
jgi:predicted transposase YbfD/YdcC